MKKQTKVEKLEPKVKKSAKSKLNTVIKWVDAHILPFVALVVLSALAVKGLSVYLPAMSENARLTASILAVAVLVVKLKSNS